MATFNFAPAASADDALEAGGSMTLNGASIAVSATTRYYGLSLDTSATPIAQGTTISSAILSYTVVGVSQIFLIWKGHKVIDSAQFAGSANNISNRYSGAPTTASTTEASAGVAGGTRRTVDLTAITQELVNQASWASTSRLTYIAKGDTGVDVTIRAWDNGADWATLVVTTATGIVLKTGYFLALLANN